MKRKGITVIAALAAGALLGAGSAMALEPALARSGPGISIGQGGVDLSAGQGASLRVGGGSVSLGSGGLNLSVGTPASFANTAASSSAALARPAQGVSLSAGGNVGISVSGGGLLLRAGSARIGVAAPGTMPRSATLIRAR